MAEVSEAKKGPRKVAKKVAATSSDLIALKTLCKDLKVDPRLARRKLRKAKITGHDARDRWAFKKGSNAYEKAREVLAA